MGQNKYIFGYGSLVSANDIARTLGHPPASLEQTTLMGWVRDWSIILNNTTTLRRYETIPDRKVPNFISTLNIRTPRNDEEASNPNGVLFPVTDEELEKIDNRETHYQRIEVTEHLTCKPDGVVYAYVGLPEYLETPAIRSKSTIPKSYLHLVEAGFLSFGNESLNQFRSTTVASDVPKKETIHTPNI